MDHKQGYRNLVEFIQPTLNESKDGQSQTKDQGSKGSHAWLARVREDSSAILAARVHAHIAAQSPLVMPCKVYKADIRGQKVRSKMHCVSSN